LRGGCGLACLYNAELSQEKGYVHRNQRLLRITGDWIC
jgi:hypothetical protein